MKKVAIVGYEGGLSSAYFVGVILALVEKYNLTEPYLVVGSSGSTATLAYYVAGQYASIRNIWENLLSTKKFISTYRLNKIMNVDYLIDDIFKKQDVLDVNKLKSSPIKLFISVTNLDTGNVEYFSNKDEVDIFEVLRASNAAPVVYSRAVKINNKRYVDGALGTSFFGNIEKAKKEGAEIVVAVDNSNHSLMMDIILKIYSLFTNKFFRKRLKTYYQEMQYKNNDKQVLIIKPSVKLPTSLVDNKKEDIAKTIQIGYDDTMNNKDLEALLRQ